MKFYWKPVLPIDTYGINDERIIKHLKKEIRQDEHSKTPT
jgi:hypothetical protein